MASSPTSNRAPFVPQIACLTLPYPPSANNRLAIARGRLIKTQAAREYRDLVAWKTRLQYTYPLQCELALTVVMYRPRKRGDTDNVLKQLFDGMNGIAFEDDSQIVEIHAYRCEDKQNPRVEVWIQPLGS